MTVSKRAGYKVTLHKSNPFDLYAIGYSLYMLYLWASSFCSRSKDYHQPWDQGYHSTDTRPELRVLSINKVGFFFFRVFFKSLLNKHLPGGKKKKTLFQRKHPYKILPNFRLQEFWIPITTKLLQWPNAQSLLL